MKTEIKMPSLKPGMKSGVLCAWRVEPGDSVKTGEVIYEVETDKVVSEIEAERDMTITSLLAEEGDTVEVGAVIAEAEAE